MMTDEETREELLREYKTWELTSKIEDCRARRKAAIMKARREVGE